MDGVSDLQRLAIAAAIGFVVGFQREWRAVEEAKERSFAGARTFALVALVGGLAGLVSDGPLVVAVAFAGVAALTIAAYWAEARATPGLGGTTEIAIMATFLLGVLATRGEPVMAAAGGVGAAILLSLKPLVEKWAKAIDAREIGAALRFLALSVIILPLLPDAAYGPYGALNPRQIWQFVVLMSGLSFVGYWLTKLFGERGVLITGVVGGLASSTAATLSLSRLMRSGGADPGVGAAGVVAANVIMLFRVAALLGAVSRNVLLTVWPALLAGALAGAIGALILWRGEKTAGAPVNLGNPMELKPALFFAALIALISVLSRFASERFGDAGLYAIAFVTGLADVDALTLSAAGQTTTGGVTPEAAGAAVLIAVASNIILKGAMTGVIAGVGAGWRVGAAFASVIVAGGATLFFFVVV